MRSMLTGVCTFIWLALRGTMAHAAPAVPSRDDFGLSASIGACGENATTLDACNGLRAWIDKASQETRSITVADVTNPAEHNRKIRVLRAGIAEANALLAKAAPVLARLAYVQTKGDCGEHASTPESCDDLREWFNRTTAAKRNQEALYASLPGAPPVPGERRLPGDVGQHPVAPKSPSVIFEHAR